MTDNEVLFVRSSKKSESKSTEGDSSTNDDDIWDDTLLIKAYEKAVQFAQNKQNAEPSNSKPKNKRGELKWKVGDKCRCQYSEDLQYYEADIIEINGSGMCTVRYVGYENEEKVPLKKLKPSEGDSARARQCKEALETNDTQNDMDVENETVSSRGNKSQPVEKKHFSGKKEGHFKKRNGFAHNSSFGALNFPFPHIDNSIIPPPPPPHIFNKLSEDENETEAMSAMLISWYMSGYHTGYYQGLKMAKKQQQQQ